MAEVASQQSQPHSPTELQSVQSLNATNKDNYSSSLTPAPGASSIITDNNHKISSSNKML